MSKQNILIVEDEIVIRSLLKKFLETHNYKVYEAGSVKEAVKHDLTSFALIISDLRLPGASGTDMIKLAPAVPVLVMTSYASLRSAVDTMKLGAVDYIAKPFDFDELLARVRNLSESCSNEAANVELLGECPSIAALRAQLAKVAPTDTSVLIEGESGTGKELVARSLHQASSRAGRQMSSLNCAAIPDTLIEAELFGHEQDTSPGATSSRTGLVAAADGSSLFLDEIGDLPLAAQARLLRVLQDNEVRPIGSALTRKVSVRVIATSRRNLQALISEGTFREDLYYRLNVVRLRLPPLRERGGDGLLLAQHFLARHNLAQLEQADAKLASGKLKFSAAALAAIKSYHWPGNIRELENAIHRAVILCDGKLIEPGLLAIETRPGANIPATGQDPDNVSLENYLQSFVLENQDRMTETELAQKLGISRKSLWQKRKKLNIPRQRSRQP